MLKTVSAGFKGLKNVCDQRNVIGLVRRLHQSTIADLDDEPKLEFSLPELRSKYPEFLPDPDITKRNFTREKLERQDMLSRRKNVHIPVFYVGSILAVTTSDVHSPGKTTRFLGICIARFGCGLKAKFVLRNVIQNQGIEVKYSLYSPIIQQIEVVKLEKRLDDQLLYLRDAPLEYSTFPLDMEASYIDQKAEVPVNPLQVPLNPRPWLLRYERMGLKGAILPELSEKIMKNAEKNKKPWEKYDLMDSYRKTIPLEEQEELYQNIYNVLKEFQEKEKMRKTIKSSQKVAKQKLF
ncbi:UNVERIFIED_CONTAM: hypothetical protein PYX00_003288 [Menopon gallinae]|uniref:Large ribosomal subunit protein bL19m n=1 Tax=Menopon gallinae TaxID=328185 RepID=A0AAW2HZX6_9NEOP